MSPELIDHLREAFKPGSRIVFKLLIEPIALDISIAISAALILNESISNALKHAFPDDMEGTIAVSFKRIPEDKMMLEVCDDGIGFSDEDITNNKSFGIRLIKGLVSDISGEVQIENHHGTTVRILFRSDTLNGRQNA